MLLLSRYLYLNHVAHLTFTELIISYIFLSFFHFEFSPSSGVSCHAAAGGERCLRRRAPRAPRTRARQRTAEKVCRKVCVQCECRAVPGPRDASRVVVARRDGSGLDRLSGRASAPRRPHATADGTRRGTNLRHRSQASLRIGCAGRCVRAEGGPGPCGRAARRGRGSAAHAPPHRPDAGERSVRVSRPLVALRLVLSRDRHAHDISDAASGSNSRYAGRGAKIRDERRRSCDRACPPTKQARSAVLAIPPVPFRPVLGGDQIGFACHRGE